jgi:hypothetical protein
VIPLILIITIPEDDRGRSQGPRLALLFTAIPPVLLMLSIYLGVVSIMESRDGSEV